MEDVDVFANYVIRGNPEEFRNAIQSECVFFWGSPSAEVAECGTRIGQKMAAAI